MIGAQRSGKSNEERTRETIQPDHVHTAAALWMSRVDPCFLVLSRSPRYPEILPRFAGGALEPTLKTCCGVHVQGEGCRRRHELQMGEEQGVKSEHDASDTE